MCIMRNLTLITMSTKRNLLCMVVALKRACFEVCFVTMALLPWQTHLVDSQDAFDFLWTCTHMEQHVLSPPPIVRHLLPSTWQVISLPLFWRKNQHSGYLQWYMTNYMYGIIFPHGPWRLQMDCDCCYFHNELVALLQYGDTILPCKRDVHIQYFECKRTWP